MHTLLKIAFSTQTHIYTNPVPKKEFPCFQVLIVLTKKEALIFYYIFSFGWHGSKFPFFHSSTQFTVNTLLWSH